MFIIVVILVSELKYVDLAWHQYIYILVYHQTNRTEHEYSLLELMGAPKLEWRIYKMSVTKILVA